MRRTFAIVAAALVSAGCGTDKGPPSTPPDIGQSTSTRPPAVGATTPNERPATGSTDRAGRPTPTTARRGGPGSPPATTAGRPIADPVVAAAMRGPGAFAGVLLQPQPAPRLVVDVLLQPGVAPREGVVQRITDVLRDASGKPVRMSETTIGLQGEVHSAEEIRAAADQYATTPQGRGTGSIRVLFLAGRFAAGESTLGVAVRGDTFAIFVDQVRRASSPLASRTRVETAVATHEIGHLLGLVDLFLDRNRADPEHPGHSRNTGSVMFWAVESDLVTTVLGGPPPIDFDEDDRSDLAAIRGGAGG